MNYKNNRIKLYRLPGILIVVMLFLGCSAQDKSFDDEGYEERKQWILEQFGDQTIRSNTKTGLIDALARLELTGGKDTAALEYVSNGIPGNAAMFDHPPVVRALFMYRENFSEEQIQRLKKHLTANAGGLLGHGTENHAAMRITSTYLFTQFFPDETWNMGGKKLTSAELMAEAKWRILRRGKGFYKAGNNEQLSSTYGWINVYPFLTLMEFAEDPEVRDAAEALVLYHSAMLSLNNFDGHVMPPFNRRNAIQQRFGPPKKPTGRYVPMHLSSAWLFWGQNEVIKEDFTAASEYPVTLMFVLANWQIPEPLNRIAKGIGAPYEIHATLSQFSYYDRGGYAEWGGADNPEILRYILREKDFAMGGIPAQYFDPKGYNLDYHTFGITWKSPDRFRSLEVMHPYWRTNKKHAAGDTTGQSGDENIWKATHSPFQQTGIYRNTAILMFDIPEKDPWAGRGRADWESQRNEQYNSLIRLAQVRFPITVEEVKRNNDFYFFREGNVYVAIRVLKPGHTLEELEDSNLASNDGYSDPFYVIKSRSEQTGFIFEVGTADKYSSFEAFQNKIIENPLNVDWNNLEVNYTNSEGTPLRFRYDTDYSEDEDGYIWIAPDLWINGVKREITEWPNAASPFISMKDGILKVEQGGDAFTVDWSGDLPIIKK